MFSVVSRSDCFSQSVPFCVKYFSSRRRSSPKGIEHDGILGSGPSSQRKAMSNKMHKITFIKTHYNSAQQYKIEICNDEKTAFTTAIKTDFITYTVHNFLA